MIEVKHIVERMVVKNPKLKLVGKEATQDIIEEYLKQSMKVIKTGMNYNYPNRFGSFRLICRRMKPNEKPPFGVFKFAKDLLMTLGYFVYVEFYNSHVRNNLSYEYEPHNKFRIDLEKRFRTTDLFYEIKK